MNSKKDHQIINSNQISFSSKHKKEDEKSQRRVSNRYSQVEESFTEIDHQNNENTVFSQKETLDVDIISNPNQMNSSSGYIGVNSYSKHRSQSTKNFTQKASKPQTYNMHKRNSLLSFSNFDSKLFSF